MQYLRASRTGAECGWIAVSLFLGSCSVADPEPTHTKSGDRATLEPEVGLVSDADSTTLPLTPAYDWADTSPTSEVVIADSPAQSNDAGTGEGVSVRAAGSAAGVEREQHPARDIAPEDKITDAAAATFGAEPKVISLDAGMGDAASEEPTSSAPFGGCARVEWLDEALVVQDMSADGGTVVGRTGALEAGNPVGAAFRLTLGGEVEWLGERAEALSVSDDGRWVAGYREEDDSTKSAVLWDPDGQTQILAAQAIAVSISGDGSVVAGTVKQNVYERTPFLWRSETGCTPLPAVELAWLTEPRVWDVVDISADGQAVLGAFTPVGPSAPPGIVVWTEETSVQSVGGGRVLAMSRDGSTAVGDNAEAYAPSSPRRWSLSDGDEVSLDASLLSANTSSSTATAVSADGSVAFGMGLVWRQGQEVASLLGILEEACVDTSGWPRVDHWTVKGMSQDLSALVACAEQGDTCWVASWR